MKQTLTAKLKLKTTPEQFVALRHTQLAYRDALNFVSRHSFEHGKISSNAGLQKGTYYDVRAQFNLPAQMTCSVMREVAATYKGHWTKAYEIEKPDPTPQQHTAHWRGCRCTLSGGHFHLQR